MSSARLHEGVHLSVTSLGTAYALAEGWVVSPWKQPLRIQASQHIVAVVGKHLETDLERSGGCGVVPVFASQEIMVGVADGRKGVPFFLDPQDIIELYLGAGLALDQMPTELTTSSLQKLVGLMLAGTERDWRASLFIASEDSAIMAQICQEEAEARAGKRAVRQMMRAAGLLGGDGYEDSSDS